MMANHFEDLTNEQLIECYELMNYWGGYHNPPADSLLEKVQLKYLEAWYDNLYLTMQLDLFQVMAKKWYTDKKKY